MSYSVKGRLTCTGMLGADFIALHKDHTVFKSQQDKPPSLASPWERGTPLALPLGVGKLPSRYVPGTDKELGSIRETELIRFVFIFLVRVDVFAVTPSAIFFFPCCFKTKPRKTMSCLQRTGASVCGVENEGEFLS